jgi:Flp pilus assembly protein TadD
MLEEAIASLALVVAARPRDPLFLNDLGCVQLAAGQVTEAEASLRRAVAAKETWAVAHYNLGLALEAGGKPGEARTCFENALRLDPGLKAARERLRNLRDGTVSAR